MRQTSGEHTLHQGLVEGQTKGHMRQTSGEHALYQRGARPLPTAG
jgi:hypothetical protein